MANSISANVIINRASRMFSLEAPVFREIARDPNGVREAGVVVGVVAIASAIGGAADGFGGILAGLIGAFLGWFIFSYLAYFIGRDILGTPTTSLSLNAMLGTFGYSQAPQVLNFFGFLGWVGDLISFAGFLLFVVLAVIAIRETLRVSTQRAVIVAIVSAIASGIAIAILGVIFGIGISF